jgi:hypothetical protein
MGADEALAMILLPAMMLAVLTDSYKEHATTDEHADFIKRVDAFITAHPAAPPAAK